MKPQFLLLVLLVALFIFIPNLKQKGLLLEKEQLINDDLDLDGKIEKIRIHSIAKDLFNQQTDIFINDFSAPVLSLKDYLFKSEIEYLTDKEPILHIETQQGHLINSLLYRYINNQLIRIHVSTEKSGSYLGTVSSDGAEFKDMDTDGVKEMLVYHRHYLPIPTVEVYKFDGKWFFKYKEYEEQTPRIYL